MNRCTLLLALALALGCGGSGTPEAESEAETAEPSAPILIVSQKAASSVAFYTLDGALLAEAAVNRHPHEIVLSPDGKRLYTTDNGTMRIEIAGEGGNTVSIIDVAARKKIGEIDLGAYHRPHGINLNPVTGELLVTTENPDKLLVVDVAQRKIVKEYDTGGRTPHIVTVSRDGKRAYVSNARSGTVAILDLATGDRKTLETGARPEGSALNRDGSRLYVAHRDSDSIAVIDTVAEEVVGMIETGKAPVRIGVTGDDKLLAYALLSDKQVGIADVEEMKQVAVIDLGGEPVSLEMAEDGETAVACAQDVDTCYVISVPERKILHVVRIREGAGPDPALLLSGR